MDSLVTQHLLPAVEVGLNGKLVCICACVRACVHACSGWKYMPRRATYCCVDSNITCSWVFVGPATTF